MSLPTPQALLEHVWQRALDQCSSGSGVIVLPVTIMDSLGQQGVLAVMQRFSAFTGHPATLTLDQALGIIQITRGTTVRNSQIPVSQPSVAMPLPNPTPDNMEKAASRNASVNPIILGKQWRNEPAEVRAHFKTLSDELKRKHHLDHPDYQFRPRKPSEKRRRVSRRAASGHASLSESVPTHQPTSFAITTGGTAQPKIVQGIGASLTPSSSQTSLKVKKNPDHAVDEPMNNPKVPVNYRGKLAYPSPTISEASANARESANNSSPPVGEMPDGAKENASNSSPPAENSARGNSQGSGAAGNTSDGAEKGEHDGNRDKGAARFKENAFGGLELTLPFPGDERTLAQLLDNWNEEHPAYPCPEFFAGAFPISIAHSTATFGALDEDVSLLNWDEIEHQAYDDLLDDEQEHPRSPNHQ
ncbi:hypothetical protein GP486_005798 [Trichoglossum hirsutum]|uniref:HMG box domain-containing protein n=1 Tax=Trichoglossum hirsutum TaxID=265104 RepID=A0A9P8RLK7_9PEZI|nr:hypothetical protein GP486_005798 [Trichoglossum hirsutum]